MRATGLLWRAMAGYLAVGAVIFAAGRCRTDVAVALTAAVLLAAPLVLGPARWRRKLLRPRWGRALRGVAEALLVSALVLAAFLGAVWWAGRFRPEEGWGPALLARAAPALFATALPEEFFFRSYLQRVLTVILPLRIEVLGARCGAGLPLAAGLFALAHLARGGGAGVLLVFFPGLLFGWLFARRRSVLGPALCHAACNLSLTFCPTLF